MVKVGGLGEVVPNLAKSLAKNFNVSVFMPSHGRCFDSATRGEFRFREMKGFRAEGYRIGEDNHWYHYSIGIEEGFREGVAYYLLKGLEPDTSRWLDNRTVYDHDITWEKIALSARGLRAYIDYLMVTQQHEKIPHVIHIHDWHMVPAGISLKQDLEERRVSIPVVFTIHVLSREGAPWHFISERWCQIKDEAHYIWIYGKHHFKGGYREVWEGMAQNYLEKFGAYESDLLTTVSESYLTYDVLGFVGEGVKGKCDYIYNGCDWEYEEIKKVVDRDHGQRIKSQLGVDSVSRWDVRRYLLTKAIGETNPPEIPEEELRRLVYELNGIGAIRDQGRVEPFEEDGPLVLMTGRLDRQKGVDVLIKAMPRVIKTFSDVKFLLLLLPIFQRELIHHTAIEIARYYNNARLILGRVPEIFFLSYLSSDVYVMPSRWEPFGITALEAMVTGNPVVGANLGGIKETVLDILEHKKRATGRLFPSEDSSELSNAIICMISITKADELVHQNKKDRALLYAKKVPYPEVRELLIEDLSLGSKIRENCIGRVEQNFRWANAAQMAVECYKKALRIANYRAWACFQ